MTIHLLTESTSRVLVSTKTLHNAVSVIKELIDNALDARATSISIEIASNTVDRIIVRDDGTGIGVEDRQLLCKRGCTSKIANLDDLAKLGGTFLGFRGTALASVTDLSKSVTIITRVDGEQPATTLTFGPRGKLLSSASASHNVGTTVRVEDLLVSVPVRRQAALKDSAKVLDQVKKLLHNYALARPTVKLSLKVLKAKNDKANWSFAACREGSQLLAAAAQVVGKATASSCYSHSVALIGEDESPETFKIDALLLKGETKELAECSNTGPFISIDGRPVSHEKGVIKDLLKLYKSYLHDATQSNSQIPSKPFLVAHIHCPSGSYDVNVEPAKDVVLFHDPAKVVDLAAKLFADAYGELQVGSAGVQRAPVRVRSGDDASSFDVLLARKRSAVDMEVINGLTDTDTTSAFTTSKAVSLVSNFARAMNDPPIAGFKSYVRPDGDGKSMDERPTLTNPYRTMSSMDDDHDVDGSLVQQSEEPPDEVEEYDPNSVTHNNPFIRAKLISLKTPTRPSRVSESEIHQGQAAGILINSKSSPSTVFSPGSNLHSPGASVQHLPTPLASPQSGEPYQNPGPSFPRRARHIHGDDDSRPRFKSPISTPRLVEQQASLGPWVQTMTSGHSKLDRSDALKSRVQGESSRLESSLTSIRDSVKIEQHQPGVSTKMYRPFRSPIKQPQSKLQRDLQADLTESPSWRSPDSERSGVAVSSSAEADADLQNILAFEIHKKALKEQQKIEAKKSGIRNVGGIRQSSGSDLTPVSPTGLESINNVDPNSLSTRSSLTIRPDFAAKFGGKETGSTLSFHSPNPHRNRYLAAIQNLEQRQGNDSLAKSNDYDSDEIDLAEGDRCRMSEDDPRSYLMQIQKQRSDATKSYLKVKKTHSSKLPFETIPAEAVKHGLLAVPTDHFPCVESLLHRCRTLAVADTYIKEGRFKPVQWSSTSRDIDQWQRSLEQLVREQYRSGTGSAAEGGRPAADLIPVCDIPLARIIKTHIDATEVNDNTNTNTRA